MSISDKNKFVTKAILAHGNKYDYTKVVYSKSSEKVIIACPTHGDFEQRPNDHLKGSGCKLCGIIQANIKRNALKDGLCPPLYNSTSSFELFYKKARNKHQNQYDYIESTFINSQQKMSIICKTHGEFKQKPTDHIRGYGCAKCKSNYKLTTPEFVQKASSLHNQKYTYHLTEYVGSQEKVIITCPVHGNFTQTPNRHLSGQGCHKCANLKKSWNTWTYSSWETAGKNSPKFIAYTFYILRCTNESETFLKVGKTYCALTKRYDSKRRLPYKWESIKTITGTASDISKLERAATLQGAEFKYKPKLPFGGQHECFTEDFLPILINMEA